MTAAGWFERCTSRSVDWPLSTHLLAAQGRHARQRGHPGAQRGATIGGIVGRHPRELIDRRPLVDELVVMDSDSSDDDRRVRA